MVHTLICFGLYLEQWNNAKAYFLEYLSKQKEYQHVLVSNEKFQRIRSCLSANGKTTLVKINLVIAVAQLFEKRFQVFQADVANKLVYCIL